MKDKIVIGSRESRLAVIQSQMVLDFIKAHHPALDVELLTMKTTGDIILDRTLDKVGGKGLFVKELDRALMDGRSDLSVHSLKDMPMEVPKELPLVAFSKREDPRDVLVLPKGVEKLDFSKPIGCSSQRRILQLKELFPEAEFQSVRGNVLTRLQKLDSGEYGALVLAAAGLKRLGLEDRISQYFEPEEIIPAAEKELGGVPRWRCIAGYSLAGLFALYAIYQTDLFSRVGSMSGSLWFPGMKEYIFTHEPKSWPDRIYFSLGDKESKTKNPILRTVQGNTEEICAYYLRRGIDTVFHLNHGNHFVQSVERTAAGLCWLLSR